MALQSFGFVANISVAEQAPNDLIVASIFKSEERTILSLGEIFAVAIDGALSATNNGEQFGTSLSKDRFPSFLLRDQRKFVRENPDVSPFPDFPEPIFKGVFVAGVNVHMEKPALRRHRPEFKRSHRRVPNSVPKFFVFEIEGDPRALIKSLLRKEPSALDRFARPGLTNDDGSVGRAGEREFAHRRNLPQSVPVFIVSQ